MERESPYASFLNNTQEFKDKPEPKSLSSDAHFVVCGVCGNDIDYSVMLDAVNFKRCKNGCGGSVFVSRAAVDDSLKDMNSKLEAIISESRNNG